MKRRLISLLLVLCMALSMSPVMALGASAEEPEEEYIVEEPAEQEPEEEIDAIVDDPVVEPLDGDGSTVVASGSCGTNLTWTLTDDGTLTISGTGAMTDYSSSNSVPWSSYKSSMTTLVIHDGVTGICDYAFSYCNGFTGSLMIPDSVTSIGDDAFYNCSGFTGNLVISNSVTTIGDYAFMGCSGFTGDLVLGDSVTTIGRLAFRDCSGFTGDLVIPNNVASIGYAAFYNCTGFSGSLVIPDSVTSIGSYAFRGCSGFTGDLVIPDSVTSISYAAFNGCSGFNGSLVIPDSVTSIGGYAFGSCSRFTGNLVIPDSVTSIGSCAFDGCRRFTGNLVIPGSVTSIGSSAFRGCGFTGDLVIPESLTSIESRTFAYCSDFTGNLVIPDSVTSVGSSAFRGCSGFNGNLVIPGSVTSIDSGVFYECSGFTGNLVIPDSVTSIGSEAFYKCSGFTGDLVIPGSVTSIENSAFSHCGGFNGKLVISDGVTSIGGYAFYECSGFTGDLVIPGSVTSIENSAFDGCSGIIGIEVNSSNTIYASKNGVLYDVEFSKAIRAPEGISGNLVIPESVTSIEGSAFANCSGFTGSLVIPDSVTSIGYYAFNGCSGFNGSLVIPDSVTSIGGYAFGSCVGFTGSLVIPDSVTSIGSGAFDGCNGFNGSLVISDSVTTIEYYAFNGCSGFTGGLVIPETVASIGEFAFADCSGFTGSLVIPDSVTDIGWMTFYGCSGFTGDLVIPSSVMWLCEDSFCGCSSLSGNVYFKGDAPYISYEISPSAFPSDFTLYYIPGTTGWTDSEYYDANAGTWNGYKLLTWDGNGAGGTGSSGTIGIYPSNGASIEYGTTVEFHMEFGKEVQQASKSNYAALDFTKTPFSVYRMSDDALIYKAEPLNTDSDYSYGIYNYHSTYPNRVVVSPMNSHVLFDIGETYYIVMGEGFVKFADGTVSPGISKGQWTFNVYGYYTVTFGLNGGEGTAPTAQRVLKGGYATEPETPKRKGYTFEGWYANKECTGTEWFSAASNHKGKPVESNITLYAKWEKRNIEYDKDTFYFMNYPVYFFDDGEKENYQLSGDYKDVLYSKRTIVEKARLSLNENSTWGGSCFGMSAVLSLVKAGSLDVDYFHSAADHLYDLPAPKDSSVVFNLINYYHLIQVSDRTNDARENYNKRDETSNNRAVIDALNESSYPVVVGFNVLEKVLMVDVKKGGHAVVAYGYEVTETGYNVKIWDPNDKFTPNTLFISKDFTTSNFERTYDSGGWTSYIKYALTVESGDYDYRNIQQELQKLGRSSGAEAVALTEDETDSMLLLDTNYASFTIKASDGTEAVMENGSKISGDLEISDGMCLNEMGAELRLEFSITPAGDVEYTIVPSEAVSVVTDEALEEYSTVLYYSDDVDGFYAGITAADTGTLTFGMDGSLSSEFETETYQAVSLADNDAVTPWMAANFEATTMGLTVASDGEKVSVSSLTDAEITANVEDVYNSVEFAAASATADAELTLFEDTSEAGKIIFAGQEQDMGCALIFYSLGGTTIEAQTNIPVGTAAEEPEDPVREGFIFAGWYASPDYEEESKWDFATPLEEDTRIYAKWQQDENYLHTVTFRAEGNDDIIVVLRDGESLSEDQMPAVPEKEGCTGRWEDVDLTNVTSDIVVNAIYTSAGLLGDVNGDGNITATDARWILQCLSGARQLTEEQMALADVNGDGSVTATDARWILQYLSGARDENYQAK